MPGKIVFRSVRLCADSGVAAVRGLWRLADNIIEKEVVFSPVGDAGDNLGGTVGILNDSSAGPKSSGIGLTRVSDKTVVGGGAGSIGIDIDSDRIGGGRITDQLIVFGCFLDKEARPDVAWCRVELNKGVGDVGVHVDSIHVHIGAGVFAQDVSTPAFGPNSTGGTAIQGAILDDAGCGAAQKGQDIRSSNPSGFYSKVFPVDLIDQEAGAASEGETVPTSGVLTVDRPP